MKLFFSITSFFVCSCLVAQHRVTVEANAGFVQNHNALSSLYQMPVIPGELREEITQVNYTVISSLLLGLRFKERWMAKIGIGYQKREFVFLPWPYFNSEPVTQRVNWLTIPLQLQYEFIKKKRLSFFLNGGLIFRNSSNGNKFIPGNNTLFPEDFLKIRNSHNVFLNGRNETGSFGTDSSNGMY
jgi:hypothetical protein